MAEPTLSECRRIRGLFTSDALLDESLDDQRDHHVERCDSCSAWAVARNRREAATFRRFIAPIKQSLRGVAQLHRDRRADPRIS